MKAAATPGRGSDAPLESKRRVIELTEHALTLAERQAAAGTGMGRLAAYYLRLLVERLRDGTFFEDAAGSRGLGTAAMASEHEQKIRGDAELGEAMRAADRAWHDLIYDRERDPDPW